jgi:hypothetical protein
MLVTRQCDKPTERLPVARDSCELFPSDRPECASVAVAIKIKDDAHRKLVAPCRFTRKLPSISMHSGPRPFPGVTIEVNDLGNLSRGMSRIGK